MPRSPRRSPRLSGPAHGGAAEDVMKMAEEIGDPVARRRLCADKRKAGDAVTGFGHRVYRAEDPRARHMRAGVERLSKEMGEPRWFDILQAVVAAMAPYARHGVNVNVDFYSGVVYHLLGIKRDLFVPIFAIGRVPGWAVQVLEQLENNILIRPLTLYNGPARATPVSPAVDATGPLVPARIRTGRPDGANSRIASRRRSVIVLVRATRLIA